MYDSQSDPAPHNPCLPANRHILATASLAALRAGGISALLALACALSGCLGGKATREYNVSTSAEAARGKQAIVHYGCGKCHTIPGIPNAHGVFGPPLAKLGLRTVIGGNFPNTPDTLAHWIHSPQEMKPKTAMPDLGLTEQQAHDAASYLETLR